MWIDKLMYGVLELDTLAGPRYVQPTLVERAYLAWIFRNFFSLPQQVLHPWQLKLIARLADDDRFVSLSMAGLSGNPSATRPIIGRVEGRLDSGIHSGTPTYEGVAAFGSPAGRKPAVSARIAPAKPRREAASA